MKTTGKRYTEKEVQSVQGLDAVRLKPGMYIGDTTPADAWTLVREKADNTVDGGLAETNSVCYIYLGEDGRHCVADAGQGIPVGNISVKDAVSGHVHKVSAFKAIVSLLHTGAKFDDKAYKISRGTHGIGIKATNALSSLFEAWTFYEDQWYYTKYERGVMIEDVTKKKNGPVLPNGKKPKCGTVIFSTADKKIFTEGIKFSAKLAFDWAKVTAYLVPGFRIILEASGGKRKEFFYENGPHDYVKDRVKELECNIIGETFYATTPLVDVALAFSDADGNQTHFYTNGLHNSEGGEHANSLFKALFEVMQEFAKRGRNEFSIADLKEGLLGLVNVKLSSPRFNGQTKQKLTDERAKKPLEEILADEMRKFFKKHREMADAICVRATTIHGIRNKFTLDKAAARALKSVKRLGFPAKFAICPRAAVEDREVYLVEGDSAGGTAKIARDKQFQEVLPLKGKIMNCMQAESDNEVVNSEEVKFILAAIGFDPNADDPYKKMRTHKIIALADPDYDGYHINSLVLTLLYKYLPGLYERGWVYVANAPEFYAKSKTGEYFTGNSVEEVQEKTGKKLDVHHLKGWGECPAALLEALAFDVKSRTLIKITMVDKQGEKDFRALMGEDSAYRKEMMGV